MERKQFAIGLFSALLVMSAVGAAYDLNIKATFDDKQVENYNTLATASGASTFDEAMTAQITETGNQLLYGKPMEDARLALENSYYTVYRTNDIKTYQAAQACLDAVIGK